MRKHINIRAGFDLAGFSSSAQNLEREFKKTARKMTDIGRQMSMAFTAPFAALSGLSMVNFDKQAKAVAQVEAGIKSTGGAAGFTSEQLQNMATELQKMSLFGDEDILKGVTAQLLTFTNIAGSQFAKTQQAALDLATRLDGDLKSASIMLGKALNDPVANLSALSRAGIQFSEDQKKMVKALIETGKAAEAQDLILAELEKQYGGSAAAAAAVGMGPLQQLKMQLMDVTEGFGEIIFNGLNPFIEKAKQLAIFIDNLNPTFKKMIIAFTGIVAAVGPLMLAFGALSSLIAAFTVTTGLALAPVIAITLALAALVAGIIYVRDNLDNFRNRWLKNWKIIEYNAVKAAATILEAIGKLGKFLGLGDLSNSVANLQVKAGKLRDEISAIGEVKFTNLKDALVPKIQKPNKEDEDPTKVVTQQKTVQSQLAEIVFAGQKRLKDIRDQFALSQVKDDQMRARMSLEFAQENAMNELDFEIKQLEKKKVLSEDEKAQLKFLQAEKIELLKLHNQEIENLNAEQGVNTLEAKEQALQRENDLQKLYNLQGFTDKQTFDEQENDREIKHLQDLIALRKEYGESVLDLEIQLAQKRADIQNKANEETARKAKETTEQVNNLITQTIAQMASKAASHISEMFEQAFASGGEDTKKFGQGFLSVLGGFMVQFGEAIFAIGIAQLALDIALKSFNPAQAIAAGIALMAAGAGFKALSKKGVTDDSAGGSGGGGGGYNIGNFDNEPIVLETRIEGDQLILVQSRSAGFRR